MVVSDAPRVEATGAGSRFAPLPAPVARPAASFGGLGVSLPAGVGVTRPAGVARPPPEPPPLPATPPVPGFSAAAPPVDASRGSNAQSESATACGSGPAGDVVHDALPVVERTGLARGVITGDDGPGRTDRSTSVHVGRSEGDSARSW